MLTVNYDLRWRMVWHKEALVKLLDVVSQSIGVDKSTISRTIDLFYATGSVRKTPCIL